MSIEELAQRLMASQSVCAERVNEYEVIAVLRGLADFTAIQQMLDLAPTLSQERDEYGERWALAVGIGRYFHALADAIERSAP